ncbi:substrate-binding domain-containing protein [Mesorhizobium sp. ArgA1]
MQSSGFSVPDDFSVIGLDDIAVALHGRPPLTTIRIDRVELGRAGIQMLMKRIADPGANIVRVNIGLQLAERATVGPVRKKPL